MSVRHLAHRIMLSHLEKQSLRDIEYTPPQKFSRLLMDFYALSLLHPDSIRNEMLSRAVGEAKTKVVHTMHDILLEAVYRAVACEIFHFQPFYAGPGPSRMHSYEPSDKKLFQKIKHIVNPDGRDYNDIRRPDYQGRYLKFRTRGVTPEELFRIGAEVFSEGKYWSGLLAAYGGKAWARIAQAGMGLLRLNIGSGDDEIRRAYGVLDHVIDLAHNTGNIFTKWKELGSNLQAFLDLKSRLRRPESYDEYISKNLKRLYRAAVKDQYGVSVMPETVEDKSRLNIPALMESVVKGKVDPKQAFRVLGKERVLSDKDVLSSLVSYDIRLMHEFGEKEKENIAKRVPGAVAKGLEEHPSELGNLPEGFYHYIFSGRGKSLKKVLMEGEYVFYHIPESEGLKLLDENPEVFAELFKKSPEIYTNYFRNRFEWLLDKHPEILVGSVREEPYVLVSFLPYKIRKRMLEEFPDVVMEAIQKAHLYIDSSVFKPEDYYKIFKRAPEEVGEVLRENRDFFEFFPEDKLMEVAETIPEVTRGLIKSKPAVFIAAFPEDQQFDVFRKFADAFSEVISKQPVLIRAFPEEDRLRVFEEIPEAFAEAYKKKPDFFEDFLERLFPIGSDYVEKTVKRLAEEVRTVPERSKTAARRHTLMKQVLNGLNFTGPAGKALNSLKPDFRKHPNLWVSGGVARVILRYMGKQALTKDDLIREYQTYSPDVSVHYGDIVVRNRVKLGENTFIVLTNMEESSASSTHTSGGSTVRVDFSVVEDTGADIQNLDDSWDHNALGKFKDYTKTVLNIIQEREMLTGQQLDWFRKRVVDKILSVKTWRSLGNLLSNELGRNPATKQLLDEYVRLRDMDPSSPDFSGLMSPTLNVEGLPQKIFPTVVLSIREGLKKLGSLKPKIQVSGIEIDAKSDFSGDQRRTNIYRRLADKFIPQIIGRKFIRKQSGGGMLYLFDSPLTAEDLKKL